MQSSSSPQPQPSTSSQPGTSPNLRQKILDSETLQDPQPGPSTTAAEFDLEVFDSGSSCSLEDSWGGISKKGSGKGHGKMSKKSRLKNQAPVVIRRNGKASCRLGSPTTSILDDEEEEDAGSEASGASGLVTSAVSSDEVRLGDTVVTQALDMLPSG